jgi:hypothetical protein
MVGIAAVKARTSLPGAAGEAADDAAAEALAAGLGLPAEDVAAGVELAGFSAGEGGTVDEEGLELAEDCEPHAARQIAAKLVTRSLRTGTASRIVHAIAASP